jgi:hypothetical protein
LETIILLAVGLLVFAIIYNKVKRLIDTVSGKQVDKFCDCGTCSSPCAIHKISFTDDDNQKLN